MKAFVVLLPPALVASLALLSMLAGNGAPAWMLLAVLPWLVLAPFMARGLDRRTSRAVDRLVRGMASTRGPGQACG